MDSRTVFLDAAATVADLVGRIPGGAWDGPGLGVWDLRALVGHTSRALVTVSTYLAQRADAVEVPTPTAYYVAVARAGGAGSSAVAQRGVAAGAALGDDPATAFATLRDDAADILRRTADDEIVPTVAGGMRVGDYLPTRTFELTVHGADISAATGLPVVFAPAVLADVATLAARVAVELGHGPALLAALTGRAALPPGFSVV
ncbi:MAG: hypothetical protein QOK35_1031 [Pseudonocardiales bacterium]|nr:hypothetical protein [Pseudonocardiales bacterium]